MLQVATAQATALAIVASCVLASGALAAGTCKTEATAKNLHGAAQTSFMNKCEKDAKAKCDADAKARGLHGAAEASFKSKCVKDNTGA